MSNQGRYVSGVWVKDFPPKYTREIAKKMRAEGKGPKNWYYKNVSGPDIEQTGRRSFIVGASAGLKSIEIPNYKMERERQRVLAFNYFLGSGAVRSKIFREGEGLMADPLLQNAATVARFKGTWVSVNDLRLSDRLIEMLGLINANPGIRIMQIANIYNTSALNIRRMVALASSYGVKITGSGKLRIMNWGAFNPEFVEMAYESEDGMSRIVAKMKTVMDGDAFDKLTGCLIGSRAKVALYNAWREKLEAREQKLAVCFEKEESTNKGEKNGIR
jgi:hypothetical protein